MAAHHWLLDLPATASHYLSPDWLPLGFSEGCLQREGRLRQMQRPAALTENLDLRQRTNLISRQNVCAAVLLW